MTEETFSIRCRVFAEGERVRFIHDHAYTDTVAAYHPTTASTTAKVTLKEFGSGFPACEIEPAEPYLIATEFVKPAEQPTPTNPKLSVSPQFIGKANNCDSCGYYPCECKPVPIPQFERRKVTVEYNWFAKGAKVEVVHRPGKIHEVREMSIPCEGKNAYVYFEDGGGDYAQNLRLAVVPEPAITPEEIVAAMGHEDYRGMQYGGSPKLVAVLYLCNNEDFYSTDYFKTDLEALQAWCRLLRLRKEGGK